MARNPFLPMPLQSFALSYGNSLVAKQAQDKADALKQQQFAIQYGTKQQQEQDRQQAQKDKQANYASEAQQRRMSQYFQLMQSGSLDNLSDDEITARTGIDPRHPFSDTTGTTATPSPYGTPSPGGNVQAGGTPAYTPGQLGSPDNPVDGSPQPMPANTMPMVPPGTGLPQTPPPAPQQGYPQVPPPNALQALPGSVGGTGTPPAYSPTNGFQIPSPYTNGPSQPQQPFGAGLPAFDPATIDRQPNLNPQTPGASMGGGMAQSQQPSIGPGMAGMEKAPLIAPGGAPPLRTLTPWGSPQTGIRPVTHPGGYDPVANAQASMQRDNDRLQQITGILQGGLIRSPKGRAALDAEQKSLIADLDKQNDNIAAEGRNQRDAMSSFNRDYTTAAAAKLGPQYLTDMSNNAHDNGLNVVSPRQYTLNRGLSDDAWKRVDDAAQKAHDADPAGWQDKTYNGKPFSFYYDENGNRLNVPEDVKSDYAVAGLAKTNAQTDLDTVRIDNVKALTDWTKQYKGVVSQSQIDRANAAIKYLNGPKTQETQAVTDMIRQGRIPEALQQIESLKQKNAGTYNPTGNTPGYLNPQQKLYYTSQQARLSKLDSDIAHADDIKKTSQGNPNMSPGDKNAIAAAQNANQKSWNEERQRVQADITRMQSSQQSNSPKGINIPVEPASGTGAAIAQKAADMQPQVCKNPGDRQCQAHAREAMQSAVPGAYAGIWDRSPDATAKSNLQRFISRGIAQPYTPGMSIPPGSILYSTKLGEGSGHASITGLQGQRYDQHGVNAFKPSDYNWFVPPPSGAPQGQFPKPGQMMTPPAVASRRTVNPNAKAAARAILGM